MGRSDFRFDTDRKKSDMEVKFEAWAKENLSDQDCKEMIDQLKSEDEVYFGNLILKCATAAGMDPDLTLYVWENGKAIFVSAKEKFFSDLYKGSHIVSGKLSRADIVRNAFVVAMYHGIYLTYSEELRKGKPEAPEASAEPKEPEMEYDKYKNFKAWPTKEHEPTGGEIRRAALNKGINIFKESTEEKPAEQLNESEEFRALNTRDWNFVSGLGDGYRSYGYRDEASDHNKPTYYIEKQDEETGNYLYYRWVPGGEDEYLGWAEPEESRAGFGGIKKPVRRKNYVIYLHKERPPFPTSESKHEDGKPMNESLQNALSVLQRAGIQVK